MSAKYHCNACDKSYDDATLLRAHRTYMRKQGKVKGHELKIGESIAGSRVGKND